MTSMHKRLVTMIAAASLAAGLVPAPALAEAGTELLSATGQTEAANLSSEGSGQQLVQGTTVQDTTTTDAGQGTSVTDASEVLPVFEGPAILYKLKGETDTWRVATTLDEAKAHEATDVIDKPLDLPQLRVEGANVSVQIRTRAPQAEWPQEWKEEDVPAAGTFEELQARLVGEDAAAYDVCYRVHVGARGWLGWARNGERAGSLGCDLLVDGLQVMLVAKSDNSQLPGVTDSAATDGSVAADLNATSDVANKADATDLDVAADPAAKSDDVAIAGDTTLAVDTATVNDTTTADPAGTTVADDSAPAQIAAPAQNVPDASNADTAAVKEPPAFITTDMLKTEDGQAESKDAKPVVPVQDAKPAEGQKDAAEPEKQKDTAEPEKQKADEEALLEAQAAPSVSYQAHVQRIGWQDWVSDGDLAGTSGESLRMEALRVSLPQGTDGGITYRAHVQRIGWQDWVSDGDLAGTSGESLRVEAFSMKLTGKIAEEYDVYYRVHIQTIGWLAWAKNGEDSGSAGMSRRMEALQVKLVKKGEEGPSSPDSFRTSFVNAPTLRYHGHVQHIGWQDWVSDGQTAGTSGQSLRVEALEAVTEGSELAGSVELNAHVQRIGWQDEWGSMCGTEGQSLRVEAFRVRLTDELASCFDVYYRVHAQKIGWMGWARNGDVAGTSAMSLRLEAIEMRLVPKGGGAPGSMENAYIDGNTVSKMGYQNPEGFYQVSSHDVQITGEATAPWDYVTPSRIGVWASREECIDAFVGRAREYLGTPYVWDYSCAPGVGVDCIGLVYQCAYACGMDLGGGTGYDDFNPWAHWITGSGGWHSHDANNFWDYGKTMHVPLSDRQVGDLISWAGHVAIYLGNDQIIEAYPGSVMYSSLWDHGTPRGCMRLFH